jgi:hypothetical protein
MGTVWENPTRGLPISNPKEMREKEMRRDEREGRGNGDKAYE